MSNIDPKTATALGSLTEFFNACPSPQYTDISGSWAIIFSSRQLLQTLFQDIDETVDRLMAKQFLSSRKTLGSLFREEARVECATIQVSNDGSFELSYLGDGGPKSIIGRVNVNRDETMTWEFAPTVRTEFTVIYTSQVAEATRRDVVILAQTDSFPKCENVLVLARTRTLYETIYAQLAQSGHNTASNPILSIECQMLLGPNPTQNPIAPNAMGAPMNSPMINPIIRPMP
ncbi:unnamed protein product, partial [Mesorhabditis belari]|uniref:Uncharacterized protein n=1 Tax=Mesorhabditis belari TaxID=2138241 RepID=A0AAF3J3Y9_9BILA